MTKPQPFSPEVRERAVRLILEHQAAYETQWVAIQSVAEKIGCSAEALRTWVRHTERDAGPRRDARPTTESAASRCSGRAGS